MIFAIILILLIVGYIIYRIKLRHIPTGTAVMVNGGVKTGKTLLLVEKACREYKKKLIKYYLKKIFCKKKKKPKEKPLLYSNIPLDVPWGYVQLTNEMIDREIRFKYESVILVNEITLMANSMCYKDEELNERLELLIKLIGHETKGGKLFIDTQALPDNHFAIKRSIDSTLWIERNINIPVLPFQILKIRRMVVCNENVSNETQSTDKATDLYTYLVWKYPTYKRYDRYAYSILTDNLPSDCEVIKKPKTLKAIYIPTFRKFKTIKIEVQDVR